ncbi:MAG: DEAD/DEAH box helicase family protein [Deltaproteobacteria bacterium]|nr:DEAD/DEAH box helicase family protein [Deltaproteobacteria bacterium]
MKAEEKARQKIDQLLETAGWQVQDYQNLNLSASPGVAVREFPMEEGFADYLLFVGGKALGVVEAKPAGTTLSGVAEQTTKYLVSIPVNVPHIQAPLPFAYESTGEETFFRDLRDPEPRSRRLFAFHRPETLKEWLAQGDSLRARLRQLPPLITHGLRDCQIQAIQNLEHSLAEDRPRALVQMATGSGKTFMAVSLIYRLIKFANVRRVLFLVDRNNLGRQTLTEFQQYLTPDDGRKFTELYNVQRLTSNTLDPVSRVCITTIQRLYSMLRGEPDLADPELEEHSLFDLPAIPEKPKEVSYNPAIPIETFDVIITDECHRSIYHLWRQVLEYFDAFIIGLTATPSKQTLGFFNQNLVMEYSHERAVADGVNVGYEVYRIQTEITEKGSRVESGYYIDKRDKLTRKVRWEQLDEDLEYTGAQLDRAVVAPDQIRTVIRTFKEKLPEIFPGRTEVPKTLIFAKDDSHAEDIVHIVREEFGKGNEFCKKITYKVTGEKPEDLIASFRNSYHPRIAVTVDMISTGTDIKPVECLLFMRDVKSPVYFEQMKGRGTRTISPTDLTAVTPDAPYKSHFVIVDAVGVCESDKTDSRPLERKKSVPFDKLLISVALGQRDEDTLTTLAGRLARLEAEIDEGARKEIRQVTGGLSLPDLVNGLLDALDPDKQEDKAREMFQVEDPGPEQLREAAAALAQAACAPFDNPQVRNKIIEIKRRNEQIIDTLSKDKVIYTGFTQAQAQEVIESFRRFMEENRDEIMALQIFYSRPYGQRRLTYAQVEELAAAIAKPPYSLTPERLWQAYERLEQSRVKGAGPQRLLTDLISLMRFALGEADVLEPWPETVEQRFEAWLARQRLLGREFTPEQLEWLRLIKDHIATSLTVEVEDLEYAPFFEKGGPLKAYQLFGPELPKILAEVNEALAA